MISKQAVAWNMWNRAEKETNDAGCWLATSTAWINLPRNHLFKYLDPGLLQLHGLGRMNSNAKPWWGRSRLASHSCQIMSCEAVTCHPLEEAVVWCGSSGKAQPDFDLPKFIMARTSRCGARGGFGTRTLFWLRAPHLSIQHNVCGLHVTVHDVQP